MKYLILVLLLMGCKPEFEGDLGDSPNLTQQDRCRNAIELEYVRASYLGVVNKGNVTEVASSRMRAVLPALEKKCGFRLKGKKDVQ